VLTNAYIGNLLNTLYRANLGQVEPLEIFKIYGNATTTSKESAKILLGWDPETLIHKSRQLPTYFANYTNSSSYGPQYFLRLYSAPNYESVAQKFYISASAVYTTRTSYEIPEGVYSDFNSRVVSVPNFETASLDRSDNATENYWESQVSAPTDGNLDGMCLSSHNAQYFPFGTENLELNVTNFMRKIVAGANDYFPSEVLLSLHKDCTNVSDTYYINNTFTSSSYKKCFYSRHYEDALKAPCIEIRYDDSIQDHRGCFYREALSESTASSEQTIALYNYHNGRQKVIGDYIGNLLDPIKVRIWDDPTSGSALTALLNAGTDYRCGIYTASFGLETTASYIYDRWYNSAGTVCFWTGSIRMKNQPAESEYVFAITNLRDRYRSVGANRFRVNTRRRGYEPQIYVKYMNDIDYDLPEYMFYKITRCRDKWPVVDYGTGSFYHRLDDPVFPLYTRLSSDVSGAYFDLDMSGFVPDLYEVSFLYGFAETGRDGNRYLWKYKEAGQRFKLLFSS
jgi:hypothetical protein